MKHYFLLAALGEIFYGVVSGQNFYNNDPKRNYDSFQSNRELNQNEQRFGQNFPPNGFEPQPSVGDGFQPQWSQQQQPSFQQPPIWNPDSPQNGVKVPFSQPQNSFQRQYDGGSDLPWNVPFQSNRNSAAERIGRDPPQSNFGSNMQPPDQATYDSSPQNTGYWQVSNLETDPSPWFSHGGRRRLRRRRRRRRKNRQGTNEEIRTDDRSPGAEESNQERSSRQSGDASSSTDEQVPEDVPNDYPGYTYPPGFFRDLLDGLGDSNKESNSQPPENDQSNYSNKGSSDYNNSSNANTSSNNDQAPPGVPNDYPDYIYPPGFFSDMIGGLEDSTMTTDYGDFSSSTIGDLDTSTVTANDEATCSENEEETDCMSPCNTCAANCQNCRFQKCETGCDCFDGFKRDSKGNCVHASLCPPCASPTSTTEPSTSD